MKYINPINFFLAIAALAFTVYVFSETFMSSGPPAELASQAPPGAADEGLSSSDAATQGLEPGSDAESAPASGAAQSDLTGQQIPPRDRRNVSPSNPRPPFRPGAGRTRPASRTDRTNPGSTSSQPRTALPAGAVIPDEAPPRPPARRQPSPPPSLGSEQDRRPLPLRDRGDSKRQPDPNAPPPTKGSRQ